MLESNINDVNNDVDKLIKDARALLHAAAALSGEKADEMRTRAMLMLDTALAKGREAQLSAIASGKEFAASADVYVKENPWRSLAALAGVALLAGLVMGRKS